MFMMIMFIMNATKRNIIEITTPAILVFID